MIIKLFCTYDDYNWDLSLQYLSQKCFKSELIAIYPIYPRVAHIGKCGTHHTNNDCNVEEKIKRLKFDFSRKIDQFFPTTFIREPKIDFNARLIQEPNGGWSDYRDHTLCKIFLINNHKN